MRQQIKLAVALMIVLAGVSACLTPQTPALVTETPTSPASQTTEPPPAPPPTPASETQLPAAQSPFDPAVLQQAALLALSTELGVPVDSITIISILPVEWNDTSLGCPAEGQAYLQVITPGYLIMLGANGQTYQAHTDLNGTAIICRESGDPIGQGTVRDPIVAEFIMQAIALLAEQEGVPGDQVVLVRSEAVDWPDSSLGCPQAGEAYLDVITPGYRIVLAIGEDYYEFHTDQQRMILCENPTQ
jgi:hypothetical protein